MGDRLVRSVEYGNVIDGGGDRDITPEYRVPSKICRNAGKTKILLKCASAPNQMGMIPLKGLARAGAGQLTVRNRRFQLSVGF